MQRVLYIWAFIWPCFAKISNPSDILNLEALNEELEYVSNRLDKFMANQGDWEEGGLDLPTKDVTWSNLATNIERLINQTVQLHLYKLDSNCSDFHSTYENALKEIKKMEVDFLNMSSTGQMDGDENESNVRECSDIGAPWKGNLIEAETNVKFVSDSVNNLKAILIDVQSNISKQEENTTKLNIELQKLISSSESTSKGQADINAAISEIEEKQNQLMEKMGYEMVKDLKRGNEETKQENDYLKSFLEQIMGTIVELKKSKEILDRKDEELQHKFATLKTVNDATDVYASMHDVIEQLKKEVTQQRDELLLLKQSPAAEEELQRLRDAADAIGASSSSHPDVAAVEAKIAEARRTCVTGDDVRRLLRASTDSKCSAKVRHTAGRPSRLHIEIVSSALFQLLVVAAMRDSPLTTSCLFARGRRVP